MLVERALREAAARLLPRAGDLAVAHLEAELLLAHALGVPRAALVLRLSLGAGELAAFGERVEERVATGRPIAYLVGRREFRGLDLAADERALVPRPETETLVDAFEDLHARGALPAGPVADRGTGSANLALAVCALRPVIAVDRSAAALELAAENLARHAGLGRVQLVRADGLGCLRAGSLAAVLANPPYVEPGEFDALPDDVRLHEPREALVPDEGSVGAMFERLLAEARAALAPGGWLLTEVGAGQAAFVAARASVSGFGALSVLPDLAGIERVVAARR